ncbi:histidine phosphatase family protein [Labrys sp. LIt4]|uniref:histidine phosphatase family protein n=1 Tax=Labrys sp. LIt4 TaxID=2821355 RepID=UPI001ADFDB32|nr:histidine phosphatase family protein [Labrys sp. LIt4]MBP0582485.1 histidine phosphatase family protein [Labrys sp. LIt4]
MTPRLILLCHGATPALRAAGFPLDEALDARGMAAARDLEGRFAKATRILSSPALRARQTAQALGLEPEIDEALRECDHGRWAGLGLEAVAAAEPEALGAWLTDPKACPHGGESIAALIARVGAWLAGGRFEGYTLAVTHASVLRAAIVHALGTEPSSFWRIEAGPLATADLRPSRRGWSLRLGA